MNVVVIAAHPDDEVLGCGATVARLTHEGAQVASLILGEGATSRMPMGTLGAEAVSALQTSARNAAAVLNVTRVSFGGLPDNRFDSVDLLDIVKLVESFLAETSPDIVLTHHQHDLNIDHRLCHQAVLTATRPLPECLIRSIYAFETPSATEWAFGAPPFTPNFFVDITNFFKVKLQALGAYQSEMRQFPHPRSEQALFATATRWGAAAGVEMAEAFQLVRTIESSLRPIFV